MPDLDVFLCIGGSNAKGRGDSTLSAHPTTDTALVYHDGAIVEAVDPVGNADTGSAYPALGKQYYAVTGRRIGFVVHGVPASTQTAVGDIGYGNWDTAGTLVDESIALMDAALIAFAVSDTPIVSGVIFSAVISDAGALQAETITQTTISDAILAMIARYRAEYGADVPLFLIGLPETTAIAAAQVLQIRGAHDQASWSDPLIKIVFRGPQDYYRRGFMKDDGAHLNQRGLNEVGRVAALNITSDVFTARTCLCGVEE